MAYYMKGMDFGIGKIFKKKKNKKNINKTPSSGENSAEHQAYMKSIKPKNTPASNQ